MGLVLRSGTTIASNPPPKYPKSGLILQLDASNSASYPGTGGTWSDISGAGNHFTLSGDTPWTSNGYQSFFTFASGIAQGGNILPNTGYTKVAIFKASSWFGNIISGGDGDQHAFWGFDTPYLQSGHNGAWSTIISANPITADQWMFGAVSFDITNGWRLYLNSDNVVTNPSTDTFANNPAMVELGGYAGNSNNMQGSLAIAMIYNRALSDAEITQLRLYYHGRFGV